MIIMRECCSGCTELTQAVIDLAELVRALAAQLDDTGTQSEVSYLVARLRA